MTIPTRNTPEFPFELETLLEKEIAADPHWLQGITWGTPRPGHPEGKVMFHIRDVLNNIDQFFGAADDRSSLRLIALIHDTFKCQVIGREPGAHMQSHGYFARRFAERYINDQAILEVIELHDEAYKASLLIIWYRNPEAAEQRARELIIKLGNRIDLFMHFYFCDHLTGDKSTAHYQWFQSIVRAVRRSA
jgi:HD domain